MILKNYLKKVYLWKKDPTGTLYYRRLGVKIGEGCTFIGTNISFSSEPYLISLGNDVRVSYDVNFITHDGGTYVFRKKEPEICIYGPINVGNNTFIGAKSMILPNINIGSNVIIGAGSIVTKDIPDNEVWAGVPAHRICSLEEYKEKNTDKFSYILNMNYDEKKRILLNKLSEKKGGHL